MAIWYEELTHLKRPWCWERLRTGGEGDGGGWDGWGWDHWLNGHEFEQTLGDSERLGSLVCCSPWGCNQSDTTKGLNNNNNNNNNYLGVFYFFFKQGNSIFVKVFKNQKFFIGKWKSLSLCLTLCDPMDYRFHGILRARILEWVAFLFSRGSSQPRDRTQVSCIAGRFFTRWAIREGQEYWSG